MRYAGGEKDVIFKRVRDLEKRVKVLEQAQRTITWRYGEVDLERLARIVENLEAEKRAADAVTSAAPRNQSR